MEARECDSHFEAVLAMGLGLHYRLLDAVEGVAEASQ